MLAELQPHGITEDEVNNAGSDDPHHDRQEGAERSADRHRPDVRQPDRKQRNLKNALVAVNPATGAVLAYYGGTGPDVKDYDGQADYNDYAGAASRPPGSSFKPYTLATALTQTLNKTRGQAALSIDSIVDGSYCGNDRRHADPERPGRRAGQQPADQSPTR